MISRSETCWEIEIVKPLGIWLWEVCFSHSYRSLRQVEYAQYTAFWCWLTLGKVAFAVFETSEGGRVVTAADMLASAGLTGEFFLAITYHSFSKYPSLISWLLQQSLVLVLWMFFAELGLLQAMHLICMGLMQTHLLGINVLEDKCRQESFTKEMGSLWQLCHPASGRDCSFLFLGEQQHWYKASHIFNSSTGVIGCNLFGRDRTSTVV